LFLPKWNDPLESGVTSTKLFEYMAAQRPVLATGPYRNIVDEILEETPIGVSLPDVSSIASQLLTWYQEYKETGFGKYQDTTGKIRQYSHRHMAERFASILDELVEKRGPLSSDDLTLPFSSPAQKKTYGCADNATD